MNTTTPTTDRAEINRRNARKSTGPKTAEGKDRSRFNAVKHGVTAKTLVLPGEDAEALRVRLDAWTEDLQPRDDVEQYLVERAVQVSWQLDRADRAEVARLASIIRAAPAEEARSQEEEALILGRRLFWDRRGPMLLYPHFPLRDQPLADRKPRTSFSGLADDPDDPARLVLRLESTDAGCRWMLDRWGELRAILDEGLGWQSPDKLKAIRLLGRQPIEAVEDDEVATLFLACWVMDSGGRPDGDGFAELWNELLPGEENIIKQRLRDRQVDDLMPADEPAAQAALLGIVGKVVTRLETLARAHRARAEADAAQQAARLSFDASKEGERLRRYQMACGRSLNKTLDTLLKIRRSSSSGSGVRDGGGGKDRLSPLETESVAETYTRIFFGENGRDEATPVGSDSPSEDHVGVNGSGQIDDRNLTPCATETADPASVPPCEPVAACDHRICGTKPTPTPTDIEICGTKPTPTSVTGTPNPTPATDHGLGRRDASSRGRLARMRSSSVSIGLVHTWAMSTASGSTSKPSPRSPRSEAVRITAPDPAMGSRTRAPGRRCFSRLSAISAAIRAGKG